MIYPIVVTLEQLRSHLKLPQPSGSPAIGPDDDDLQLKLDAATQTVCEYIADRYNDATANEEWIAEIEGWTGSPQAPPDVKLAILEQAAEFYRFRGDEEDINAIGSQNWTAIRWFISPRVDLLLWRYRKRVLA